MTGNKKAILTKVCTFCMCFFSLFSLGTAAIAWFCNNKIVKNSGIDINSDKKDISAIYRVYRFNKSNKGTNVDDENIPLSITDFSMNTYDTIFTSQNDFTPAVVWIHLYGKDLPEAGENGQEIKVKVARNISMVDTIDEDTNEYVSKYISNATKFSLSEITEFGSYIDQDDIGNESNQINSFFTTCVSHFRNSSTTKTSASFVTKIIGTDATTIVKTNQISLEGKYTVCQKQGDIIHANMFLYIDYDMLLIDNFTGVNEDTINGDFLGKVDTVLENDLASIFVEISE